MRNRVVITGLGVIAPNGIGVEEFWRNTVEGNTGIKPYAWGNAFGFKSQGTGQVLDFNPTDFDLSEAELASHGRYIHFALASAEMAVKDSRLNIDELDPMRTGVLIASAIADAASMEKNLLALAPEEASPLGEQQLPSGENILSDNLNFGIAANEIARRYNAAGPVYNLSTGCTAGVDALGFAFEQIRNGYADIMIAGASEAPLCPLSIGSFEALGALSSRECSDVATASCPYSKERDGFVIAEGCGIFVLESYENAVRRGATIYAELIGYASVNNAYHMTDLPAPGTAMAECIKLALEDANCTAADINHISSHGSSTPQNDENESSAIKSIFGDLAYKIPVNSLKSMTGHALSAANAIELVALCMEFRDQVVFPTINYQTPDDVCDLDYVANIARDSVVNCAIKLSSGFSGIHSVIALRAA